MYSFYISVSADAYKWLECLFYGLFLTDDSWLYCRMSYLNIQLLVQWSGLMQRIHFFCSIPVGALGSPRYMFRTIFFSFLFLFGFSNSNLIRGFSTQLEDIWCTLLQHLNMHLITNHLTSTGTLHNQKLIINVNLIFSCETSSIFSDIFVTWHIIYLYFRCTADCGWITGHSYVTYGPLLNGTTVVIYEGVTDWQIICRLSFTFKTET